MWTGPLYQSYSYIAPDKYHHDYLIMQYAKFFFFLRVFFQFSRNSYHTYHEHCFVSTVHIDWFWIDNNQDILVSMTILLSHFST